MTSTNQPVAKTSAKDESEICMDCEPNPTSSSTTESNVKKGEEKKEDLLDPTTFIPPIKLTNAEGMAKPLIVIEYCQRCKFGLRANWIQQELLSTFAPSNESTSIASIMLIPKIDDASSGRFRIYILPQSPSKQRAEEQEYEGGLKLVWDRKTKGGFPEMKILKQKIRDHINPHFNLGHSDRK